MLTDIRERALAEPVRLSALDPIALWCHHDACVVQSPKLMGPAPFFYPIYQWGDLWSYSPLPLLIRKGVIDINPKARMDLSVRNNDVSRPDQFIDREINRVGGPPFFSRRLTDRASYVEKIAAAMKADVADVEAANPGTSNLVLCGGRDSLNLLLLPWSNPVVALSAQPNFSIVQKFVSDNGLGIVVQELKDDPPSSAMRTREIAEACGMVDMENWKWTPHLVEIAKDFDRRVVFWKGQLADTFLTDFWRSYSDSRRRWVKSSKKVWRKSARILPSAVTKPIDTFALEQFRHAIWNRGAVGQGAHMGFLRSITESLWVSAYHGPRTASIWNSGDLPRLTHTDLRPEIGEALFDGPVCYPTENPSPPSSEARRQWRSLENLVEALEAFGVARRS